VNNYVVRIIFRKDFNEYKVYLLNLVLVSTLLQKMCYRFSPNHTWALLKEAGTVPHECPFCPLQ